MSRTRMSRFSLPNEEQLQQIPRPPQTRNLKRPDEVFPLTRTRILEQYKVGFVGMMNETVGMLLIPLLLGLLWTLQQSGSHYVLRPSGLGHFPRHRHEWSFVPSVRRSTIQYVTVPHLQLMRTCRRLVKELEVGYFLRVEGQGSLVLLVVPPVTVLQG